MTRDELRDMSESRSLPIALQENSAVVGPVVVVGREDRVPQQPQLTERPQTCHADLQYPRGFYHGRLALALSKFGGLLFVGINAGKTLPVLVKNGYLPVLMLPASIFPQRRAFPCVLCSQVIEHVPKESPILNELCRVLKPGGRLVLGTPDYANWQWVYMEKLYGMVPGGYKDEHISHYTRRELVQLMTARGLRLEEERYILRGELIQAFRTPATA